MDVCFIGMGLIEVNIDSFKNIVYKATQLGEKIFNDMHNDMLYFKRNDLENIILLIKNKSYVKAEEKVLKHFMLYGETTATFDILGQLLLRKKNYDFAYAILKHAYETSSKRGRVAKSVLYHLVLCCRRIKAKDDLERYEEKLNRLS